MTELSEGKEEKHERDVDADDEAKGRRSAKVGAMAVHPTCMGARISSMTNLL